MERQDVAWRHGSGDDFVAADFVVFEGLINDLLKAFVFCLADFRPIFSQVVHVFDGCLAGNPAFCKGSGRELVGGAANRVAGAE